MFNFLVAENRFVAAALIPTIGEKSQDKDIINLLEKKALYNEDDTNQIKLEIGTEKRMQKVIEKAKELEKKNKLDSGEKLK